jgi:hypothetical protein
MKCEQCDDTGTVWLDPEIYVINAGAVVYCECPVGRKALADSWHPPRIEEDK